MTDTIQKYSPAQNQEVTHRWNLNDGLTIVSIPIIAGAVGGGIALFSVPFTVVTMLGMVFTTFFGPMILGMMDRNYAYSQTLAKVTKSPYRRLSREKYQILKNATKAGHQVRIPLKEVTDNVEHESDMLVINGKNFSVEGPANFANSIVWDESLESTVDIYSIESRRAA